MKRKKKSVNNIPFGIVSRRRTGLILGSLAALAVALAVFQPWKAGAQQRPKLHPFVSGPIGIALGQTMRLNLFIPAGVDAAVARANLAFVDGITGERLLAQEFDIPAGKGVFLDYTDPGLAPGERRCVLGIVSPRDSASGLPTGKSVQVYNSDNGRTTLFATPYAMAELGI